MKHTQGEWVVEHLSPAGPTILSKSNSTQSIANVFHSSEVEANAKLIAAAPELLEALKCAYANCKQSSMTIQAKELIEKAIEKATV